MKSVFQKPRELAEPDPGPGWLRSRFMHQPWPRPGVAVLLTGMGSDGAAGLLCLRQQGWHTIAQDQASSVVYGMPRAAAELGAARQVLPVGEIAGAVVEHFRRGQQPKARW